MAAAPLPVVTEPAPDRRLKATLERLAGRFDRRFLETDPLKFPHRYADPRDREVVALLAAAFAYGSVPLIFRALERILAAIGPRPRRFLDDFDPARDRVRFRGFRHRFHGGRDLALFLSLLSQAVRRHGDLRRLFLAGFDRSEPHVGPALTRFVASILGGDPRPFHPGGRIPDGAPVRFLLSSPADGSACKRMLLFLRWVVRPADGLDLGLWPEVPASKLLLPLDTHTYRLSRYLGLTARRQADWKAAEEITTHLRRLDPIDPVRYDFALCRLGILDLCPAKRNARICVPCDLYEVCQA